LKSGKHWLAKLTISQSKWGALCSISLRQLERFFALRFGKTPGEWSRELKCRRALKLITEGYSNKAVAAELRFAGASHFCHEFKRVYGASPQSFLPGSQNVASRQLSSLVKAS
jgi:AraC-like DNA-binding protein